MSCLRYITYISCKFWTLLRYAPYEWHNLSLLGKPQYKWHILSSFSRDNKCSILSHFLGRHYKSYSYIQGVSKKGGLVIFPFLTYSKWPFMYFYSSETLLIQSTAVSNFSCLWKLQAVGKKYSAGQVSNYFCWKANLRLFYICWLTTYTTSTSWKFIICCYSYLESLA